jgi:hypothetical protein
MADSIVATPKCRCGYCTVSGLVGPVAIITVGVLFLVAEYSRYSFADLWPILLIVIGILLVARAVAPNDGHIGS